jgi:hypothetical protein
MEETYDSYYCSFSYYEYRGRIFNSIINTYKGKKNVKLFYIFCSVLYIVINSILLKDLVGGEQMTVGAYIYKYDPDKVYLESSDVDLSSMSSYSLLHLTVIDAIKSDTDKTVKLIVKEEN